jgi:hypothetical protein
LANNATEKAILITVVSDVNGVPCKKSTQVQNIVVEKAALPREIVQRIAHDLVGGSLQLPLHGQLWLNQAVVSG